MTKLERIIDLPFEEYMIECWKHVHELAAADPIASIIRDHIIAAPAMIEANWARRYWYHKNGVDYG